MPLTANANGVVTGSFSVPPNVPSGTKAVRASGSGGSIGSTSYVSEGTIEVTTLQQVTTTIQFLKLYDPLAQTFTLTEDRLLSGIDLWFCVKGDNNNSVTVQIREASLGLPTQNILAEGRLEGRDIVLNQFNRIPLLVPTFCASGREYAIVVMTDDANHAVGVGELGKYAERDDAGGLKEGWVTQQPYQNGELLSSSNASTWTPHPTMDLTMRLLACKFTQNQHIVDLGNVSVTNMTDFMVRANVLRHSAATDVEFQVKKTNNPTEEWVVVEMQWIPLVTRLANATINVRAVLKGDEKMSPVLFPNTLMLFGNITESANYISRAIRPDTAQGQIITDYDVTVTYEALKPGGVTVTPKVQTWKLVGGVEQVNGGTPVTEWKSAETLNPSPVIKYTGGGWQSERHTFKTVRGVGPDRYTRVQIELAGNPRYRPQVRNLRVVIKPNV